MCLDYAPYMIQAAHATLELCCLSEGCLVRNQRHVCVSCFYPWRFKYGRPETVTTQTTLISGNSPLRGDVDLPRVAL